MMEIMFLWFALSMLAGWIAEQKGRSGVGFFFLSIILTPLIGLIAAAVASKNEAALADVALRDGKMRRCQDCAELVLIEAIKCKHCGSALPPQESVTRASPSAIAAGKAFASLFKSSKKQ
jgi:hypothetical protein